METERFSEDKDMGTYGIAREVKLRNITLKLQPADKGNRKAFKTSKTKNRFAFLDAITPKRKRV